MAGSSLLQCASGPRPGYTTSRAPGAIRRVFCGLFIPSAETGGIFTNEINRLSSEYRNRHTYELLARAAISGERVFAVVVGNHVPTQEPALRCALLK